MGTKNYYNLDEMTDDDYLEEAPASYMVVILYYLTLRSGETNYLLLTFDNYVKDGTDSFLQQSKCYLVSSFSYIFHR